MFAHLSSTSWNTQLGVCVVVKMRLSRGILGAVKNTGEKVYTLCDSAVISYSTFTIGVNNCVPTVMEPHKKTYSGTCISCLTFISRVHPLGQQEAAELLLRQLGILDLHQVGSHAERIVLEVSFPLLATTATHTRPQQEVKITSCKQPLQPRLNIFTPNSSVKVSILI